MVDIEKWKKLIFLLPEQVFFDLIRNYLGEVKSPFNKHTLMDELAAFLCNEKNLDKILAFIDKDDAEVLTILSLFGRVQIKKLYAFFADRKSYSDFYLHLQNLEERMLICADESVEEPKTGIGNIWREQTLPDTETTQIHDISANTGIIVSQLFEDVMKERVADMKLLIPAADIEPDDLTDLPDLWYSDSLMFSVLSFLYGKQYVLKIDGNFRKKIKEELKEVFPDQLNRDTESRINTIIRVLIRLKLIKQEQDSLKPIIKRWREFSEISAFARYSLALGAAVSRNYRLYSPVISKFIDIVSTAEKKFKKSSLVKIFKILAVKNPEIHELDESEIIKELVSFSILVKAGEYYFLNKNRYDFEKDDSKRAVEFVLQPNFDIYISDNIEFKDGVTLAALAEIKRYSKTIFFSLSRDTFLRALEAGFESAEVINFFDRCTGFPIPQNVRFLLETWNKEYRSITFYNGIVLVADDKKSNIIDNSGYFNSNLCKKISHNVYLLNPKNTAVVLEAFSKAGIENVIIPKTITTSYFVNKDDEPPMPHFMEDVYRFFIINGFITNYSREFEFMPKSADLISPEIKEKIEASGFTPEQKKIIYERAERKLVFSPDQISRGNIRFEKTEARSIDYTGKMRLVEESVGKHGYLLEINQANSEGGFTRHLVKPDKIEKDGKTSYLIGRLIHDNSVVNMDISKIYLIRKIKTSLFTHRD